MKRNLLTILVALLPLLASAYDAKIDGIYYNFSGNEAIVTYRNNQYHSYSGSVTIPETVTYDSKSYTVTSIGVEAFSCCHDLNSVVIPNSVTSIGNCAFMDCVGLTCVVIPNSVTVIKSGAFYGCVSLTSVTIPKSVTSIGRDAFCCSDNLTNVTFESDAIVSEPRTHTNSLQIIFGHHKVKEFVIGDEVSGIGSYTFYSCVGMESVRIGSGVTSIGGGAFESCRSMTDVYCYAENVPETGIDVFKDCPVASATLHVPDGSVEKYKATAPWNQFGNIVALPIEINETTFPDENFRSWILAQSYGADGVLTNEEIAGVKRIMVTTNGVQNLKGIEYFTSLTTLYCSAVQLTEIDVSECTKLTDLDCSWNQLTSLDVSQNIELMTLNCGGNQLTVLDVSKNTALDELHCYGNQLTTLDVLENTKLTYLNCHDNQLNALDLSNNIALERIWCSKNLLTSLDVSNHSKLESLKCTENRLTKLNVSGCPKLEEILAYCNRIKGEAMDCLIAGLPVIPNGWGHLPIMSTENEQNVMTKSQVAAAKAKGWNPLYKYGTFDYPGWLDYEGSDDPIDLVYFATGQMATIILPTAPDASKGKYYRLDRCEKGQIVFEQELHPQARTPYIIVPDEDFSIDPITLDLTGLSRDTVAIEGISFIGSYVRTELPASTGGEGSSSYIDIIDLTPDCGLLPSEETGQEAFLIGALRAYLDVDWTKVHWDDPYSQTDPKGVRNKLEIVLLDYGTGIDEIQNSNFKIQNGEGSAIYDLSGRRVNNSKFKIQSSKPQRGIYIENGKKILHSTHP